MIKKILKSIYENNAIWALVAILINTGINLTVIPYVSEKIGIEAYGFVSLANTFISYIDIISVALNAFASRYVAIAYHQGDIKGARKYYSSIFFADFILGILFIVFGAVLIPNLQYFINISPELEYDVKILFAIVIIRYFFIIVRTSFDIAAFVKNRLDLTEKFRTVSYFIQAISLIVTCSFFYPHVWYVSVASLSAALFLLVMQIRSSHKLVPELKIDLSGFSWRCIADFLSAGIWNSINNIGNLLNSGLDLLISNRMLTEAVMGYISVAKSVGSMCYSMVSAISKSFQPKQLLLYSANDTDGLINALKKSMRITGSVCAIIMAGFYSCGADFLKLWLPSQDTTLLFNLAFITLLSDIMIGVVNPLYYVFTLTKKLRVPCVITIIIGIINVLGMYVLIKYTSLGGYAVVLTTMILNFVHFVDTPIYAAYCLKIPKKTFYHTILLHFINVFVNFFAMSILKFVLPEANGYITLILNIVVLGTCGLIVSLLVMTSSDEKKLIIRNVSKAFKR